MNKVVGIQQKDYDCLSECTLENIHFVLEHLNFLDNTNKEVKVSFPRFDRIVCENTSNRGSSPKNVNFLNGPKIVSE